MKLPTLSTFCDTTATALLLAGLLWAAWLGGGQYAQHELREYCDGLNVVLLDGTSYKCEPLPKAVKLGGEP